MLAIDEIMDLHAVADGIISLKARTPPAEAALLRKMQALMDRTSREALRQLGKAGYADPSQLKRAMDRLGKPMAEAIYSTTSRGVTEAAALAALRDRAFEASSRTLERMTGNVTETLARGVADGVGVDEMARSLGSDFKSMRSFELKTIARTETHGARLKGEFNRHVQSAFVEYHQWWTAEDERVRGTDPDDEADHTSLHGIIVRVGDPFPNGLVHPGDTSGNISEWINCRCGLVPFFMPPGKTAPKWALKYSSGKGWFREEDLVDIAVDRPAEPVVEPVTKKQTHKAYVNSLDKKTKKKTSMAFHSWFKYDWEEMRAFQQGKIAELEAGRTSSILSGVNWNEVAEDVALMEKYAANVKGYKGVAYRGMNLTDDAVDSFISQMKTGAEIEFDAFTSTSISKDIANEFAEMALTYHRPHKVFMEIRIKKGIDLGAYGEELGKVAAREREIILNKHARLKVKSIKVKETTFKEGVTGKDIFITLEEI